MTRIAIRKSGGASIVSIPKAVLKTLGLQVGSTVDLSLEDDRIILIPVSQEVTLDELLAGSPKKRFALKKEDKEWLKEKPKGKEL